MYTHIYYNRSAMSQYPDTEALITDACVPLSSLSDIITSTKNRIEQSSLPCPILAHAGEFSVIFYINFNCKVFFYNSLKMYINYLLYKFFYVGIF